jgi:hypothetical protein
MQGCHCFVAELRRDGSDEGAAPALYEHWTVDRGCVNVWHPACADRYLAAMVDPPVKVPELPPDPFTAAAAVWAKN